MRQLSQTLRERRPEPLVQALNALFEQIDEMVASERRFATDAAHELRNPITAIRAQARAALGAGTVEHDHALQFTLVGYDRATRLVEHFYQVLGNEQPDRGLGRSIARRIAKVLGARVQISHSEALGGLAVSACWATPAYGKSYFRQHHFSSCLCASSATTQAVHGLPRPTTSQKRGTFGISCSLRQNTAMQFQKIFVPLASATLLTVSYYFYSWPGAAVAASALLTWLLLHFTRMMQILRRAAQRPMGYVASSVMLNAKLEPGSSLLHVVAMTHSLGELISAKDSMPEMYRWTDNSESHVTCEFSSGKLTKWTLFRLPSAEVTASDASPAAAP